ncbi:MAG: UDP-N-acetylglucosamine 1-carboxyvinyltransferase [Gammaproteobacteria bacterium]|nr:UDP-N-acetylglucosamine 1-carboxyvinyltransferase [Pseudomonadota bacterium]MCH9662470.1 UDP-N-acetylglucosamine 1-carboxyvinyltransferase [Gammaproteobacteria bacterium]
MKSSLIIRETSGLSGEIEISGSKNATLPILAASLLTEEKICLINPPHLSDVTFFMEMMMALGTRVSFQDLNRIEVHSASINRDSLSFSLVRLMRASILLMGSLLSRCGYAHIAMPGGCVIGWRPIDQHLSGFKALGAEVEVRDGFIHASAPKGLRGGEVFFDVVTVTGTENIMMAAVLAKGRTVIHNSAREPEVCMLGQFLNSIGAQITGLGTATITVDGVDRLHGGEVVIPPDRIEAGTYMLAAIMSSSSVRLNGVEPQHMGAVIERARATGAEVRTTDDSLEVDMRAGRPQAVDIETGPYPEFPTDMQAQFTALNTISEGESYTRDTVFQSRFKHVGELVRMGADIQFEESAIRIRGVSKLRGTEVVANDLRASASLVLAGIVAQGETVVREVQHIDRGYERIEEKFYRLGADIRRV